MQFAPKKIVLKNGTPCVLNSPAAEHAAEFLSYLKATAAQTPFLIRYPEEIALSVEDEGEILQKKVDDPRGGFLSAWIGGKLAGNASLYPVGPHAKVVHRASFGIAILQEYWGLGIGEALLQEILLLAKSIGYEQIELEVVAGNTRGIALYEKLGFVRYGTRPNAFQYKDGSYADEHLMAIKL